MVFVGINRKQRYERAVKLGLNPPEEIGKLVNHPEANLKSHQDQKKLFDLGQDY